MLQLGLKELISGLRLALYFPEGCVDPDVVLLLYQEVFRDGVGFCRIRDPVYGISSRALFTFSNAALDTLGRL